MSRLADKIGKGIQWALPTPFTIAILLTVLAFGLAFAFTENPSPEKGHGFFLLEAWENGLWNPSLLAFAVQMMLILVLGHCLALSPPVFKAIQGITKIPKTTAGAAAMVAGASLLVSLFNWGLGLIFGAILSRNMGETFRENDLDLNYPLVGAAGYTGFMVWHGGISGSATTKAAESGHLESLMGGVLDPAIAGLIPEQLGFSETVFSSMNLWASALCLLFIPGLFYLLGRKVKPTKIELGVSRSDSEEIEVRKGADTLDHTRWFSLLIGGGLLVYFGFIGIERFSNSGLTFINPNYLNGLFLGLCLVLHKNIHGFLKGIQDAIGGSSGILIQFPLYFGIMGLMKSTGMISGISDFFVSISTQTTYPIYTLLSSGLVNVFVPSGGGQWAVQGPIIVSAALEIGVPLPKAIMALCYGDQLTNMLQPFWALPLLGITGLKAKEILPYTLFMMLAGFLIFSAVLLVF